MLLAHELRRSPLSKPARARQSTTASTAMSRHGNCRNVAWGTWFQIGRLQGHQQEADSGSQDCERQDGNGVRRGRRSIAGSTADKSRDQNCCGDCNRRTATVDAVCRTRSWSAASGPVVCSKRKLSWMRNPGMIAVAICT